MVLSAYEQQVSAEIEGELREHDALWARRVDALVAELAGRRRVRSTLLMSSLLGGIALLGAAHLGWMTLELAMLSGSSITSIRLVFTGAACILLVTAVVLLFVAAYDHRRRRAMESCVDGALPEG